MPDYSYISPKLELKRSPQEGLGVFVKEPLHKDELLCLWGGQVLEGKDFEHVTEYQRIHGLQVDDDLYLIPLVEGEAAEFVNHSCDPNAGIYGQIGLIAMRDIASGEEICFDYAMSDSNDYDEFDCNCGTPHCRKRVTSNDWKRPDLQRRYAGYFSPYLQRRIDALKQK